MKLNKILSAAMLGLLSMAILSNAFANEVQYTVNKPTTIIYQIAHQNKGQQPVLSSRYTVAVKDTMAIAVNSGSYQFVGVVIDNIDGHELPPDAKQFGMKNTCTMSTDKQHPAGVLNIKLKPHEISCMKDS